MPTLTNYQQFNGRHWETGTVHNYFAYRAVLAPHTNKPYSEALLMGVSGGIVMGYFSFAYDGVDPMAHILTRNTFDPLETMLSRLGIVQHRLHTAKPQKGLSNLLETLAEGVPAIVWADLFSLPYNAHPATTEMWAMLPILVYGHDAEANRVSIADRARVSLTVTPAELHAARARVKKDKFRVLTLDPPNPDKLASAVHAGIWDCIKLFTEKPPKGSKNNFGLAAYQNWAKLLTKPKQRLSWEKVFPAGRKMVAGLMSQFADINNFNGNDRAERPFYADFLDEASLILNKPALKDVAQQFRHSADAWQNLGLSLLPDDVPIFKELRELMLQDHALFMKHGGNKLAQRQQIRARQNEIKVQMETDFPLDEAGVLAMRENIAEHVLQVHDIEETAVIALRDTMS